MKKILFFLILFHASAGTGHALTCVPKTGNTPDDNRYLKYWGGVLETYLQCGGSGGGFHICKNGVVVEGWDGNLHKCTKNGWETVDNIVDNIKVCEGELQEIEQKYNGLSNMGTLFTNKSHNSQWLYYYNTDEANGYTAIKNYCKYDYNEFEKQLAKCTGDFLHWNDNDTVTLCDEPSASSPTTPAPPQSTKLARTSKEINCKNTGGDRYDAKNDLCVCNAEEKHLTQTIEQGYSICRCMDGYHRASEPDENGKYVATGECVYAPETQTKIERDDMAMQRDAEDAYRNEYDNAQSWANKGTTALSTLMTGEGAMMAARAIAEKIADDDAEEKMSEYVSTMKCEYGGGQSVKLGDTETLPGGNELANYYTEYKQLADKLKATKAALNLRPGIEAEVLYDRAETGLYQYQNAERQSGGFTSLSRALMNPEGADAKQWNAQRAKTNRDLLIGGTLATVGLAGSYIANRAINKDHKKEYKELEEKFNKIETKLLNKYPEAFVPEEIPVKPSIEEPVIDTIDEIDPIIEQTQPAPQLDFKPFSDKYLFASGSYKLKNKVDALDEYIQDVIDTLDKPEYADFKICIKIDGHTDRVPPKPGFMSNQELSQKRAASVKDYMTTKLSSINSHISTMDATGHGEEQCTKDKYKKIDDANCRRIDITIEACDN